MMSRWFFLGFSVLFAAASLLTVVKGHTVPLWKLAILVGEFGHWLVLLPLAVGLWAGLRWSSWGGLSLVIVALSLATAVLLMKPAVQAARLARDLPAALEKGFGAHAPGRTAFAWARLYGPGVATDDVEVTTRVFAQRAGAELALDFYRARNAAGAPAPCVVVIHGGGWDSGDRKQLPGLNRYLATRGYAVAAVSYGLAPQNVWPAQSDDVAAAVRHLRDHAAELGVDPARLVVLGRSAGGQLASAIGYGRPELGFRGVISLYGPHDMEFAWRYSKPGDILDPIKLLSQYLGGSPETARANYTSASGYLLAHARCPPTLLMHGRLDTIVWHRQDERLHARLDELGVPNVFVSIPWGVHAFDFNLSGPSGQLTTYALEWYLAAVTRG